MALYKATKDGNVKLTKTEEETLRAEWATNAAKPVPEPKKTLEQRVIDLEAAVKLLSK